MVCRVHRVYTAWREFDARDNQIGHIQLFWGEGGGSLVLPNAPGSYWNSNTVGAFVHSSTEEGWRSNFVDMNGDGLPDFVLTYAGKAGTRVIVNQVEQALPSTALPTQPLATSSPASRQRVTAI